MPCASREHRSIPVIASEAKQSISRSKERMDCFGRFAPRNDGIARTLQLLNSNIFSNNSSNNRRRPVIERGDGG
jgi:hypothetical protein